MHYGTVFPTCEIGNDPSAIRSFATSAESLGYSHLLTYDHVLGADHADRVPPLTGPYTERDAFHEPFVLFAYLAAATHSLQFATGVLILPQRQTALVAKQAAELALLSENRFRLGLGIGWNWVEYEALGVAWQARGKRLDEQVALLRRLWSDATVDFSGRHHRVARAGILPRPEQPIPVWFGGMSQASVERAVRDGDGFIFASSRTPGQRLARFLQEQLSAVGRDPASFGVEVIVPFGDGPDEWKRSRDTWAALGATHFTMRAMSTAASLIGEPDPGFTCAQQHIDALGIFMDAMA